MASGKQWLDRYQSGCVRIEAYSTPFNWSRPDIPPVQQAGVGTGFFVPLGSNSPPGWKAILTCSHVLGGALKDQIKIIFPKVGRKSYTAFVHACCPEYDLAIIAFKLPTKESQFAQDVEAAIQVMPLQNKQTESWAGRSVSAFGYPLGSEDLKFSSGEYSGFASNGYIQTTADINPGNSGGPLVDNITGSVVGVNALTMGGLFVSGVHFAVPIQLYVRMAKQLLSGLEPVVVPPSLGFDYHAATEAALAKENVQLSTSALTGGAKPGGVYVYHLAQKSPLRGIGLKPGCIITEVKLPNQPWEPLDRFGEMKTTWNGSQRVSVEHVIARVGVDDAIGIRASCEGKQIDASVKQMDISRGSLTHMMPPFGPKPQFLLFGGLCVMPLRANHAEVFPEMFAALGPTQRELELLVVTTVFPGYAQAIPFSKGDIIESVNGFGKKAMDPKNTTDRVDTVEKYREHLMRPQNGFISITNTRGFLYVLSVQEAKQREQDMTQVYTTDKTVMEWLQTQ